MIIAVREKPHGEVYFEINGLPEDDARRAAFRFYNKRKEEDYNELVHNTYVVTVVPISQAVAGILLSWNG